MIARQATSSINLPQTATPAERNILIGLALLVLAATTAGLMMLRRYVFGR